MIQKMSDYFQINDLAEFDAAFGIDLVAAVEILVQNARITQVDFIDKLILLH